MQFFVAVLVLTLVAGIVAAAYAHTQAEGRRYEQAFASVRQRFGGRVEESFWSGKSLHFELEGVPAELTYFRGTDKAPPWTKLHLRWGGPRLRVAPEGVWAGLKKVFGAQDIQVGDAGFDRRFLIQGAPESWVRRALSRDARRALSRLYATGADPGFFSRAREGVTVDVTRGGVIVKVPRNLARESADLQRFVEYAAQVLTEFRRAQGEGTPEIQVQEVARGGKCPVCSDGGGLSKRCKGCGATYHPECWSYLGGCAVFGCGDRYRRDGARARSW